jgi:two-component system, OmpR family, sensor histidine kinase TctE
MLGILLPLLTLIAINTASLYRQALRAVDTAYDRTLLASAKTIGEQLQLSDTPGQPRLTPSVPYSALEAFEADNRSRMVYKVTGFAGEMVSGFEDLPPWRGTLPLHSAYAALVDFYDDEYHGQPVRVAVLLQPVAGVTGQGMATIQVAETLELRHALAGRILIDTLWRQAALVALIAVVVVTVVQRSTRPVRELSQKLRARAEDDLSPIEAARAPRELQPVLDATNAVMARLARLLEHQKRFVRDASHQLRTPLAVLKAQVQSARRGDVAPAQALAEIEATVDGATELANQMLALAKVEQLRQQGSARVLPWGRIVRAVALDLAALIGDKQLDFELDAAASPVRAHEWMLRELTRNLLHNAIKQCARGGSLALRLVADGRDAVLTVADSGPGIDPEQRERLFQPFSASPAAAGPGSGAGLGLVICHEIVASLAGTLTLDNRIAGGRVVGLDAVVRLPLAERAGT